MTRRFGLDLLRALAIAGVLVEHGAWFPGHVGMSLGSVPYGYLGVEVFFVLSGFLVGGMALDAGRDLATWAGLRAFWRRRWYRTLPNYFLFVTLVWCVDGYLGRWRPESVLPWLTFTQGLAWPLPHWFRASWSLSIEEWFYLLFPLGLGLLVYRGLTVKRAAVLGIGLALTLPLLLRVASVELHDTPFWDTRTVTVLHGDPIAWGVLAAAVMRWRPQWWAGLERPAVAVAGVAGVIICTAWYTAGSPERWAMRTVFPSFVSASIALTIPWLHRWRVRETVPVRGVRAVARWSYSMYLVDAIVYPVMFLGWPGFPSSVGQGIGYMLLYWGAVTVCAAGAYRGWEVPWLQMRDRLLYIGESTTSGLVR